MEKTIVQILVVVVITKMRTLWTEVENGFGWRAFRSEWVDPKRFFKQDKKWDGLKIYFLKPSLNWKGKWLKFHYLVKKKRGNFLLFFGIMYLWWHKRTLRLERKEGVELSSLFKRKEEGVGKKVWIGQLILKFFTQHFISPNLKLINIIFWFSKSPQKLKELFIF